MGAMNHRALYQSATFLLSAARLAQLPVDQGVEVAFAGRSNAGKSSVLNVICQQKSIARTSKTPGRTQHINVFELDDDRRLIDLPGYGYAKVPEKMKRDWQSTMDRYLQTRQSLSGIILVMDIRHPLKEFDRMMVEWAFECQLPTHILLNKADKLKRGAAKNTLLTVQRELEDYQPLVSVQLFSALKRQGDEACFSVLDNWFKVN